MRNGNLIGKMFLAAASLSLLAGPASAQGGESTNPIKIGFETSTSGVAANVGQEGSKILLRSKMSVCLEDFSLGFAKIAWSF